MASDGSNKEIEVAPLPDDGITGMTWHPSDPSQLLVSSWDSNIRLYNVEESTASLKSTIAHRGPPLAICFGSNNKIYAGGLDKNVREIDLETSQQRILGTHDEAVSSLAWSDEAGILVSGSFDSTLRIFKPSASETPQEPTIIKLPAKVFSMDIRGPYLVAAMAFRHIWIWNVDQLASGNAEPLYKRESNLRYMMRCVRISSDLMSFVCTSVEGRVAVEYLDPDSTVQSNKYAFKCHRHNVDGVDNIYPVNALAFHPKFSTFGTGGGDSMVAVWDQNAKKRIRQYAKYPSSISALSFSCDGTRLAIACSINPEEGSGTTGKNALLVRTIGDEFNPKK